MTVKPIYNVIPPGPSNATAESKYAPSPPTAQVRIFILIINLSNVLSIYLFIVLPRAVYEIKRILA